MRQDACFKNVFSNFVATDKYWIFIERTTDMTQQEDIKRAVEVMKKGGVILYPTDTVWGIGCDATNAEAVARIYDIKKRDDSKAMICPCRLRHPHTTLCQKRAECGVGLA